MWKDEIVLNSELTEEEDIIAKCAISHGLALSVKLAVFEEAIEKTIQGTKHLPEDLALDGTINMCACHCVCVILLIHHTTGRAKISHASSAISLFSATV